MQLRASVPPRSHVFLIHWLPACSDYEKWSIIMRDRRDVWDQKYNPNPNQTSCWDFYCPCKDATKVQPFAHLPREHRFVAVSHVFLRRRRAPGTLRARKSDMFRQEIPAPYVLTRDLIYSEYINLFVDCNVRPTMQRTMNNQLTNDLETIRSNCVDAGESWWNIRAIIFRHNLRPS